MGVFLADLPDRIAGAASRRGVPGGAIAVAHVTGVVAPARPVPPPRSGPGAGDPDSSRFAGRYATPLCEYEVTADGYSLTVVATPIGLAAALGRLPTTDRYVPFEGDTYITAEPEDGTHDTLTFVHDGRFLHAGRAAPRVPG